MHVALVEHLLRAGVLVASDGNLNEKGTNAHNPSVDPGQVGGTKPTTHYLMIGHRHAFS